MSESMRDSRVPAAAESARALAQARLQSARQRRLTSNVALLVPVLLALGAGAWQFAGRGSAAAVLVLGAIAIALVSQRSAAKFNKPWLTHELDLRRPDLEDSSDLLFRDEGTLGPLEQLQLARLQARLRETAMPDLRPDWPAARLLLAWLAGGLITVVLLFVPLPRLAFSATKAPPTAQAPAAPGPTRIVAVQLQMQAPAYTGLPATTANTLDAKAAQDAKLRWSLRFDPAPASAALLLHDGKRIALQRDGQWWRAEHRLDKAILYRLQLQGGQPLKDDRLYRVDVIPDRPPQVRVLEPEHPLSLLTPGQRNWSLAFEANDDYGLGAAQLRLTLAQGSGENIAVSERTLAVSGQGDRKRRRYSQHLNLAALGFSAGDDLIVRLSVADKRSPRPQTTHSASFILRWPPETAAEAGGLDGLVKRTLPAYFRSQRQIIIDSEALIAQRRKLAADTFVQRSDAIGVDQRILRLRYGQFLGEEAEGDDRPAAGEKEAHDDEQGGGQVGQSTSAPAPSLVEQFGHTHDQAEAATLLDPETRALLKSALDQMWRAEEQLRLGKPSQALPFEYRALDAIKRVQQASRIYLARVGLELPPIDESRRLTGDRAGLRDRGDALNAASPPDAMAASLWRQLDAGSVSPADLERFERWLREREESLPDPLDLLAATDALRRDPGCRACARQLRSLLWPLLPTPAAGPAPRRAIDASGRAYLDALRAEHAP